MGESEKLKPDENIINDRISRTPKEKNFFVIGVVLASILGAFATSPFLFWYWVGWNISGTNSFSDNPGCYTIIIFIGACIGAFGGFIGGQMGLAKSKKFEKEETSNNFYQLKSALIGGAVFAVFTFWSCCGIGMLGSI